VFVNTKIRKYVIDVLASCLCAHD